MTVQELRKIIREEVQNVFREELREILEEAAEKSTTTEHLYRSEKPITKPWVSNPEDDEEQPVQESAAVSSIGDILEMTAKEMTPDQYKDILGVGSKGLVSVEGSNAYVDSNDDFSNNPVLNNIVSRAAKIFNRSNELDGQKK